MIFEVNAFCKLSTRARKEYIDKLLEANDIDIWHRTQLLAQALVTPNKIKTYAQTGDSPDQPAGLRKLIEDKKLNKYYDRQCEDFLDPLSLEINQPSISFFPPGSWALRLSFILRKSYISRDDTDFYILDNPVKKEWVFKVPYIAPSQWKGALRSAMVQKLVEDAPSSEVFAKRRFKMAMLFGDEKGEEPGNLKGLAKYLDDNGGPEAAHKYRQMVQQDFRVDSDKQLSHHQGSLHFYPTYFRRIGLEVINPHDRGTGTGKQPIYFECVPKDTNGTFTLLYVPLFGPEVSEEEAKEDLEAVTRGVKAMMTRYGFGAKTSSGFGVADVDRNKTIVEPAHLKPIWDEGWKDGKD